MRSHNWLFVVFVITGLGSKFDIPGYLAAAQINGIRLSGDLVNPVNGYLIYHSSGRLEITLHEQDDSSGFTKIKALPDRVAAEVYLSTSASSFIGMAADPEPRRR